MPGNTSAPTAGRGSTIARRTPARRPSEDARPPPTLRTRRTEHRAGDWCAPAPGPRRVVAPRRGGKDRGSASSLTQEVDMPPSSGKAQLFAERDYGGAVTTLEEGIYHLGTSTAAGANGTVSSLKVAPGYTLTVYSGNNLQGASATHGRHGRCRRRVQRRHPLGRGLRPTHLGGARLVRRGEGPRLV